MSTVKTCILYSVNGELLDRIGCGDQKLKDVILGKIASDPESLKRITPMYAAMSRVRNQGWRVTQVFSSQSYEIIAIYEKEVS